MAAKIKCRNCKEEFYASEYDDLLCSEACAKEWDAWMFEKRHENDDEELRIRRKLDPVIDPESAAFGDV